MVKLYISSQLQWKKKKQLGGLGISLCIHSYFIMNLHSKIIILSTKRKSVLLCFRSKKIFSMNQLIIARTYKTNKSSH